MAQQRLAEARTALNAGAEITRTLWGVWHLLEGADSHAMDPSKVGSRAMNPGWRDPVATFEIERHGDPHGQVQTWRIDLARGTAECVAERPLRVHEVPSEGDLRVLAHDLAQLIRAGGHDPRLRWEDDSRLEVKVLADSALGGTTSGQATRLRKAIAVELGDGWRRERGLFVRVAARQ